MKAQHGSSDLDGGGVTQKERVSSERSEVELHRLPLKV